VDESRLRTLGVIWSELLTVAASAAEAERSHWVGVVAAVNDGGRTLGSVS